MSEPAPVGVIHHVEIWVRDLATAGRVWGWLLSELGYVCDDRSSTGQRWTLDATYVYLEAGPDVLLEPSDRRRAGVNHLAFHAGSRARVDGLLAAASQHGWSALFADRYPWAGGRGHYAAYLENTEGFEVELVASSE